MGAPGLSTRMQRSHSKTVMDHSANLQHRCPLTQIDTFCRYMLMAIRWSVGLLQSRLRLLVIASSDLSLEGNSRSQPPCRARHDRPVCFPCFSSIQGTRIDIAADRTHPPRSTGKQDAILPLNIDRTFLIAYRYPSHFSLR